MEKTKEQLIEAFKKNNKQRREIIAKSKGYTNAAEYLLAIYEGKVNKKPLKTASGKTPKKRVEKVEAVKEEVKKEMLDYVVAFDTTGSMSRYLHDVKMHVQKLIPEMFSQDIDLKMKIIAFGDYCDMKTATVFDRAYQQSQFTNNIDELVDFVKGAKDTSGGDGDEFYELVIKKIVEETPWRDGAKKAVLFIADYDPHKIGYSYSKGFGEYFVQNNQIDWKEEARKAADKGIAFDTLAVLGDQFPWYKELSKITGGVWMPFQSSHKMSEVVKASAYARGSKMSKMSFSASMSAAEASGDEELIGTYKSLSTLL